MLSHIRLVRRATRSLSTTAGSLPSSRYTDPQKTKHPAVSTTPRNLTPEQRATLQTVIRVDQAGEVAANWIYMGQHAVLGREPKMGALLQESDYCVCAACCAHRNTGNVGPGEETSVCDEQITGAAPGTANAAHECSSGSWVWFRCRHSTHGPRGCDGLHRGCRDGDRRTLQRVSLQSVLPHNSYVCYHQPTQGDGVISR